MNYVNNREEFVTYKNCKCANRCSHRLLIGYYATWVSMGERIKINELINFQLLAVHGAFFGSCHCWMCCSAQVRLKIQMELLSASQTDPATDLSAAFELVSQAASQHGSGWFHTVKSGPVLL